MKSLIALSVLFLCLGMNAVAQPCSPSLPCPVVDKWSMAGGSHDLTVARESPVSNMKRAAAMCAFCHNMRDSVNAVSHEHYWGTGDRPRPGVFLAPGIEPTEPLQYSQTAKCLSCHDGTVASSAGNNPSPIVETTVIPETAHGSLVANVSIKIKEPGGTRSRCAHPVGFRFNRESAQRYPLRQPSSEASVDEFGAVPLYNSRLECATCHDPHLKSDAMRRPFPTGAAQDGGSGNFCLYCHL